MSAGLAAHMGPAARRLLGEPNKHLSTKAELRFGTHGSVSVDLKKGTWFDHEANQGGGVLDLIRREEGSAGKDAVEWLERELSVRLEDELRPTRPVSRPQAPDLEAERRRELAQEIWRESEIVPSGLPTEYLTLRRGITRWDPDRLRWHPECPWERGAVGCLVVCVNDHRTACTTAIWRIRPAMAGKVERKGLGPMKGNAARLFWAEDEVAITEGVEDALAFHQLSGLPTWAALSAGNMAELVLPARLRRVVIVQDNDEPNRFGKRPGPEAAQALGGRLRAEGRKVELLRPEVGKDANDLLLARGGRP